MSEEKKRRKVRIWQRIALAFFNGLGIGMLASTPIYLLASGLNLLAGEEVVNAMALAIMVFASFLAGALGMSVARDIEAIEQGEA